VARIYLTAQARGRGHGTQGSHAMNILYVCHRFPFPPKRGGKIGPST